MSFRVHRQNYRESINSDLRRKVDDHQHQVRKSKPAQKGRAKKLTTRKSQEPAEIDEDGFILVTGKNAARRPQKQIQPQQATRGQPTTQYEVLSSDEDDEEEESERDEESKSDEDEQSQSEEEDNNRKKDKGKSTQTKKRIKSTRYHTRK